MEGFIEGGSTKFSKGAEPGGLGDGSPPVGSRTKPKYGAWGTKSREAEANCDFSVQF